MLSIKERDNMIHFLVMYFGENYRDLSKMNDHSLEGTYEFAYSRTIMDSDF